MNLVSFPGYMSNSQGTSHSRALLVFCDLGLRCDYGAHRNDTLHDYRLCSQLYRSCTWLPWLPDVLIAAKMVILPLSHSQDLSRLAEQNQACRVKQSTKFTIKSNNYSKNTWHEHHMASEFTLLESNIDASRKAIAVQAWRELLGPNQLYQQQYWLKESP